MGTIGLDLLRNLTPYREAEFYFCGPTPFMQNICFLLRELGVDDSRMHFEFFGPKQELFARLAAA